MSSARAGPGAHQRERTQLFANARPLASRSGTPIGREPTPSFNDSVLNQLEQQHDDQIDGLSAKVRVLRDLSVRIGDEVRDSSSLLQTMEGGFETARTSVKNVMTRMIRTADQSGISWRSWLGFFAIIALCFWFVLWL